MEESHGEMQRFHYEALKNPEYANEGMMNVLYEELMMNMPVFPIGETPPIIERKTVYRENLTDGKFLQLQAQVHSLQEKVNRLTTDKKKKSRYD